MAYDDPCHLLHGQGIGAAPRRLLERIPDLELVPLADADRCCGGAGIYNLTQPEVALRLLQEKIAAIAATGADLVVTANPGCQLQIAAGLRDADSPTRVAHLMSILGAAIP